jgi:adenylyltransferase/sulfurtransferase
MLVANPAEHLPGSETCVVVCRLGNDSQIAVDALRSVADSDKEKENIRDLVGGLVAWSKTIDDQFPIY